MNNLLCAHTQPSVHGKVRPVTGGRVREPSLGGGGERGGGRGCGVGGRGAR